ncbi:MAG: nuclear transport factor 2 family protein [Holophagaceae bacterium]|uniref:Nuclear transport factor 2 family protein n=1 Tax=Candidatus Geothrix skivensis TaxID=2954439 RepID=A0A9D7SHD2_9BACT|nr:nuclear transport factor 2 family protein [Candidatus Geothrix skivensis]
MNPSRHLLLSLAFAAAPLGMVALQISCARERSAPGPEATAALLKRQADRWDQDIIRKDAPAIARNMSDDFRHISHRGSLSDRETFLRDILSPDLVIHPYAVEDLDIRVYGTCALLSGRTRMTGSYQGKPFKSHYRYVDTYVLSEGQWRVCNVQITALPE